MNYTDEQIINIFADMVTFKTQYRGKDLSDVLSELDVTILKDVLNLIKRLKAEKALCKDIAETVEKEYEDWKRVAELNAKKITELQAENEKLTIELKAMRGSANSYKAEVERLKDSNNRCVGYLLNGEPILNDGKIMKTLDEIREVNENE